jgi:hypothetical protein
VDPVGFLPLRTAKLGIFDFLDLFGIIREQPVVSIIHKHPPFFSNIIFILVLIICIGIILIWDTYYTYFRFKSVQKSKTKPMIYGFVEDFLFTLLSEISIMQPYSI